MVVVWIAFIATAVVLAVAGLATLRYTGEKAPVFRKVGRFLSLMAIGTAAFPILLTRLDVFVWAGSYILFVVLFTIVMTFSVLKKARQIAEDSHLHA